MKIVCVLLNLHQSRTAAALTPTPIGSVGRTPGAAGTPRPAHSGRWTLAYLVSGVGHKIVAGCGYELVGELTGFVVAQGGAGVGCFSEP